MKLLKSKKGNNVANIAMGVVGVIVAIIIVFQLVGNTASNVIDASNNITASGLPLADLFQSDGVALLIYMAGVLIAVIGLAFSIGKKK